MAVARPGAAHRGPASRTAWTVAAVALLVGVGPSHAQASASADDPWKPLAFLEGTWQADADGAGGAKTSGRYTFRRELDGHVLARLSTADASACTGPVTFDCAHGDVLYVFQEAVGQPLKAIYLDNEGHVIHYTVTSPAANEALFLSDPAAGPRFRLVYSRDGSTMTGRFQVQMPGGGDWRSYLEWHGQRR